VAVVHLETPRVATTSTVNPVATSLISTANSVAHFIPFVRSTVITNIAANLSVGLTASDIPPSLYSAAHVGATAVGTALTTVGIPVAALVATSALVAGRVPGCVCRLLRGVVRTTGNAFSGILSRLPSTFCGIINFLCCCERHSEGETCQNWQTKPHGTHLFSP
jgi:hypothetical protein